MKFSNKQSWNFIVLVGNFGNKNFVFGILDIVDKRGGILDLLALLEEPNGDWRRVQSPPTNMMHGTQYHAL